LANAKQTGALQAGYPMKTAYALHKCIMKW